MGCFFGRIRLWKNSKLSLSRKTSTQSFAKFSNSLPAWNCTTMTRLSTPITNLTNFGIKFLTLRSSWHETIWHAPRIHILSTWRGTRNHSNLWNARGGNSILAPTPELWTLQSEWRLPFLGSLFLWVSEAAGFFTTVCKDALRSFPCSFIIKESNKFFLYVIFQARSTPWVRHHRQRY